MVCGALILLCLAGIVMTASVWTVACAMLDGRPVAVSSGDDRTLRTWDLTAHRELLVTTLPDISYAVAVTPEGDLVAVFGWELCMFSRYWRAAGP